MQEILQTIELLLHILDIYATSCGTKKSEVKRIWYGRLYINVHITPSWMKSRLLTKSIIEEE